jgi:hypothetical protein
MYSPNQVFLRDKVFNINSEGRLGLNMPNKNRTIQIFQMAIQLTKFSSLVTFFLVWRFLTMRHRQASNKGAIFNYPLQTAGTTYQPKIYLHKYSRGNIKSLKINFIRLNYREFNQTLFNQHQIRNLLISTFKIWMTEKLFNDFKIILEC